MHRRSAIAASICIVVHVLPLAAQKQDAITKLHSIPGADVSSVALSPDNRWLVYSRGESEQVAHLWLQPLSGGPPVRLSSGDSYNSRPIFTPSGDRIIYVSTFPRRSGDTKSYLVAMPFDSRAGRSTGSPRQVSLDGVASLASFWAPAISPDGKWIAYVECCDANRLRVIPSTGGTAETLATGITRSHRHFVWARDGSAIFFTRVNQSGSEAKIMRVSLKGGSPVELRTVSGSGISPAPDGRHLISIPTIGTGGPVTATVMDLDGRVISELQLPMSFQRAGLSTDRKFILGLVRETRAVIRAAPVAGGPARQLSKNDWYDWPQGWTADHTLYYLTGPNMTVLSGVTVDGTTRGLRPLPAAPDVRTWGQVLNGYALYSRAGSHPGERRDFARKLDTGKDIELTSRRFVGPSIRGAGGTYSVDGDAYIYQVQAGNTLELRSIVPGRESRLLKRFPAQNASLRTMVVHRGRVVYTQPIGDSVRVLLARDAESNDVTLATLPAPGRGELAWSRDGRHLAFAPAGSTDLHVLRLADDGSPVEPARKYTLPFEYFYEVSLLPGGRGATMIAQPKGGPNAVVAYVSFDDPLHPVLLSRGDGSSTWGHMLSPDGRWVAYAAELPPKGTTVWKLDLTRILEPRRTRAQSTR